MFPTFPRSAVVALPTTFATSWTIWSAAPYGALQGSFSLLGSGAQALFALATATVVQGAFGQFTTGRPVVSMRLVVNPGSVSVPANVVNTTTDSSWRLAYDAVELTQRATLLAVTSLGTGNFSVQVQAQGIAPSTAAGSLWEMETGGVQLFVTEAVPAYP